MTRSVIIIAEAGVNHNGDIDMALRLVDAAAEAGADFVKFQTFSAERLATRNAEKAGYQLANTDAAESQFDMLRRLELSPAAHDRIISRCRERGIGFFSTGFDIESLDFLAKLELPMVKVPSGEITNLPYLRHIAAMKLPVLLSTGMATLDEVGQAVAVLENGGVARDSITALHCTSDYPAAMQDVNLRAMQTLEKELGVAIGYSDHTLGIEIAVAAVALGATVIEKHFTLDTSLPGPDHRASLEPAQLTAMVAAIRNLEVAMGDGIKRPCAAEEATRRVARKSLVAARPITKGTPLSAADIAVKRPGTGISPMQMDSVLGRPAPRDFAIDELIEL